MTPLPADPLAVARASRHTEVRSAARLSWVVSVVVLISLMAAGLVGFATARKAVRDDESRLLSERASAVSTLLEGDIKQVVNQMIVLGTDVGVHLDHARTVIGRIVASQRDAGVIAIAVAKHTADGFHTVLASGQASTSAPISAGLQSALARALNSSGPAATVLPVGPHRDLVYAMAAGDYVLWQETLLPGLTPLGSTEPFKDLRGALYFGTDLTSQNVLLTSQTALARSQRTRTIRINVGPDVFTLVVAEAHPLVGAWANRMPWLVLAAAAIIAIAMSLAIFMSLARRDYARAQVAQATRDLAAANGDLRRTRSFLDHLVTAGPVAVLQVNPARRHTTYASPNLEPRFGFTLDDVWRTGFPFDVVEADDVPVLEAALEAASEDRNPLGIELRLRTPIAGIRWVSAVLVSTGEADGEVLVYLLDVDERHKAEEAQRVAMEAAEAANRSKTFFVSRMSHELRTPLNSVLGYAQLLEMDDLTDFQRKAVEYILTGGRHLLELINEILDISAIEVGRLDMVVAPVDVWELVSDVVGMTAPIAEAAGVTLEAEGCFEFQVLADAQRARQVLINLVTNAVKYNRPGGGITVTCAHRQDTIEIAVTDTGIGISPEQIDLAFAPFERLGAQTSGVEGKGIGLWLSRRLAEAMHGSLTCRSAVDQGTTFTLSLPAACPKALARPVRLDFTEATR